MERMCCNTPMFVGETVSSHNLKVLSLQISTTSNMRLRLGYTRDFATSEQFRSDLSSGTWLMIWSSSSGGSSVMSRVEEPRVVGSNQGKQVHEEVRCTHNPIY